MYNLNIYGHLSFIFLWMCQIELKFFSNIGQFIYQNAWNQILSNFQNRVLSLISADVKLVKWFPPH